MYRPANLHSVDVATRAEFESLAVQLSQPADFLMLNTLYAAPSRIYEGMLVKADGSTWNPGSGAGIYARVGASWVKL